jgi:hypothetical protein
MKQVLGDYGVNANMEIATVTDYKGITYPLAFSREILPFGFENTTEGVRQILSDEEILQYNELMKVPYYQEQNMIISEGNFDNMTSLPEITNESEVSSLANAMQSFVKENVAAVAQDVQANAQTYATKIVEKMTPSTTVQAPNAVAIEESFVKKYKLPLIGAGLVAAYMALRKN